MRTVKIEWADFEAACDSRSEECRSYLDLETGEVSTVLGETREQLDDLLAAADETVPVEDVIAGASCADGEKQALREAWRVEEFSGSRMASLADVDLREEFRDLEEFIPMVADAAIRTDLERAIQGKGAFRRFRDVIHGTFRERKQWFAFRAECQRRKAAEWLAAHAIAVEWVMPEPPADRLSRPPPRQHLLAGVLQFARRAAQLPGVTHIALLGSLTREEPDPKDADLLVRVNDEMDLAPLAAAGRKLAGHAQQIGRGADVFLANDRGEYLGRTCHWRECGPGIRMRCAALHCGRRHYLHDDLRDVRLDASLVARPPVELWPTVQVRGVVPGDVESIVLAALRANAAQSSDGGAA